MGNPALGSSPHLPPQPTLLTEGKGTGTTGGGINWIGYLTTVDNASLVLSYNLAIGGAGIDNTIVNTTYPDMASQVATFEEAYSRKPPSAPWGCEDAVFGWWIGINEFAFHPLLLPVSFHVLESALRRGTRNADGIVSAGPTQTPTWIPSSRGSSRGTRNSWKRRTPTADGNSSS